MKLHQRIRREQGRHTDDWLITYADTITLLLCLFVVILSLRTTGKDLPRAVAESVNRTMAPEGIFESRPPFHMLLGGTEPVTDESRPEIISDASVSEPEMPRHPPPAADRTSPDSIGETAQPGPDTPRRASMAAVAIAPLVSAPPAVVLSAAKPETAPASLPAGVERLKSRGAMVVEQQGDRITTLQISSATFFASGYAVLSGAGKTILRDVALTLKSSEFAAYHISIEGHTDDTPISTAQFQSNWELSTARAAAVVRFFLEQGLPSRQLSAAGYADTFPIAPNRNVDGTVIPENQAKNRRVVIKLEKIDKAER